MLKIWVLVCWPYNVRMNIPNFSVLRNPNTNFDQNKFCIVLLNCTIPRKDKFSVKDAKKLPYISYTKWHCTNALFLKDTFGKTWTRSSNLSSSFANLYLMAMLSSIGLNSLYYIGTTFYMPNYLLTSIL